MILVVPHNQYILHHYLNRLFYSEGIALLLLFHLPEDGFQSPDNNCFACLIEQ